MSKKIFDVGIVGAGVLGVTIAYWLSKTSGCSILLIDKDGVAAHTSSRNTGVVHRPFYLDPEKKRIFGKAAEKSYFLWSDLAKQYDLPWDEVGTLEVALEEPQLKTLSKYRRWALENGMSESEVQVIDSSEVSKLEPLVRCMGAIYSKRDTAVDYGILTKCVFEMARKNGVEYLEGFELKGIEEGAEGVTLDLRAKSGGLLRNVYCSVAINAAGGNSIDIAHDLGLAQEYTDLHFRGEYWIVNDEFGQGIRRNVYSVAKHSEFPFLDPHFIVRANRRREVGPNAVLVTGPNAYKGLSGSRSELAEKLFERPVSPKLRLFTNSQFLTLVWQEWRSSISKKQMCERVRKFIPSLEVNLLGERGLSGVRSSVIDNRGFVPEALIVEGKNSLHILNYNSPGATGAPAYSAYVVRKILGEGLVSKRDPKKSSSPPPSSSFSSQISPTWNFESASDL